MSKRPALRHVRTALSVGVASFCLALVAAPVAAQQTSLTREQLATIAKRKDIEKQLEDAAVIDRKVMVKMRDGKRMAADIYRPKNAGGKVPAIFVRTPYNFNFWDVKLGAPRDMTHELEAVKRGYAFVEMNERGHYFSEGNYEILGVAAVVQRQGRHHRLLVDGRMADGGRGSGRTRPGHVQRAGIRCRRGPCGPLL